LSENRIQTSFAAGELAPSIFARTDLSKYHSGAAVLRNFFVDYRSGASTRQGSKFIIQALISNKPVRLIPFQYSTITSYMLEFGDFYVRFINNGTSVLESGFAITGATASSPGQLTVTGNNFVDGDWIFVQGINGATGYNGRYYLVSVSGATVTLSDVNGVPINAGSFGIYTSGGTASRVYKLASPYAAADLALLKFTQSASVMTFVHPNYPPTTLSLISPTNWVFSTIVFGTTVLPPSGVAAAITGAAGSTDYAYVVTSIDDSGQESVMSSPPATIVNGIDIGATAGTVTLTWVAATGAVSYNIYKAEISFAGPVPSGAAFGFIGSATGTTFIDSNIVPDFATTPPIVDNPFTGGNNPGTTCYFQQRQVYGGSNSQPQTFWMSQPGAFNNFNLSDPTQPDDAITGALISLQVNAIKSMLPMPGGLVILTSKGAWQVSGGGNASTTGITPANATAVPQAYNGASELPPIVANYDIIFVQAKGSIVRDLSYNFYVNIYTGQDISILSNHLFLGRQLKEWAYAEEPFKLVWAVTSDGAILSLTFVKEQEIYGWARHDTLGQYQSVASITEGQVDAIYTVVKRYLGGQWVQMIERFADRAFPYGAEDAWSVDCAIQSIMPTPAANLTVSASTGLATFTADQNVFSAGSVGSVLRVGGGIATITVYVSPTVVQGNITQPITATLANDPNKTPLPAASGSWSLTKPSLTFTGLDYLNGQTVSILADGSVIAPQVVSGGVITLAQPATKVVAGLAFQAQLQTMYLDVGEPTIQGKRKKINALTVRAANTRGLKAGRTFATVIPIKQLTETIPLNGVIPLLTGDARIVMDPLWDVPGQICIQVDDPLPATVLGVIPEITQGDTAK
jgi:hypothetical protein